jgi:hypothetical protein
MEAIKNILIGLVLNDTIGSFHGRLHVHLRNQTIGKHLIWYNLCECSNEVLCASVLVKSGLENRDYGRKGSAALTMRHPSIRKSCH